MLIRLISDIHLDFDMKRYHDSRVLTPEEKALYKEGYFIPGAKLWQPSKLPTDSETILVLAGDIWFNGNAFKRFVPTELAWIEDVAANFKAVVMVLGNHDFWGSELTTCVQKQQETLAKLNLSNVHLLEKSSIVIDNVKFVGGVLWTNMRKLDPLVLGSAKTEMAADYHFIKYNTDRKLFPLDIYEVHKQTIRAIHRLGKPDNEAQQVVVVTHMAPSYDSVGEQYRRDYREQLRNNYYYSSLEASMFEMKPSYWFHGHMHNPSDYVIGKTRVMCNPRGYVGQHTDYDPMLLIDTKAIV